VKIIKGDLLESKDWNVAAHNANSLKTFGAGIALAIKKKWPEVYQADINHTGNKLGNFSFSTLPDNRVFFNLYAMNGIGNNGNPLNRNCSYDALYDALYKMCEYLECDLFCTTIIGVPLLGCGLAGGEWVIVEAILKDIENKFDVEFYVYVID